MLHQETAEGIAPYSPFEIVSKIIPSASVKYGFEGIKLVGPWHVAKEDGHVLNVRGTVTLNGYENSSHVLTFDREDYADWIDGDSVVEGEHFVESNTLRCSGNSPVDVARYILLCSQSFGLIPDTSISEIVASIDTKPEFRSVIECWKERGIIN